MRDYMREKAPIAVFAFNRPEHLHRVLMALAQNDFAEQSKVTIFCDGPRTKEEKVKTDAVRAVAHSATGFFSVAVIERAQNMGCAASVMNGLRHMFSEHERLIVIEDDILCSKFTLKYLNSALSFYEEQNGIFSISAWAPPAKLIHLPEDFQDVYFVPRFHCWGWALWRDRFAAIDWEAMAYAEFKHSPLLRRLYSQQGNDLPAMLDLQMAGKLDTWDILIDFTRFWNGKVCVNPRFSYTTNIGIGCGSHTIEVTDRYDNNIELALADPQFCTATTYDFKFFLNYAMLHVTRPSLSAVLKEKMKIFRKKRKD